MGVVTLGSIWEDVRDALGRSTLDTDKITRWANACLREFGYAFKFRELEGNSTFNTVAGTESYDLAADFRMLAESGIRKTSPTDHQGKLKKETREQWRLRRGDTTVTTTRGNPEWYHRYGSKVYLRTIPDSVVVVEYDYWKKITPVAVTGDTSPFSDDWDDVWLTGTMYRGFRAQSEHSRYINVRNDFLGLVRSRQLDDDVEEFAQGGMNIIQDDSELTSGIDG